MALVFVSYASGDVTIARQVATALRSGGVDVWIAPDSIRPGEAYNEAIVAGLRASDALAVLVSTAANASRHVTREVALADDLGKTIFPVRIQAIQPSDGLTYYLNLPQWIEWHKTGASALEPLLRQFHRVEQRTLPLMAAPASQPPRTSEFVRPSSPTLSDNQPYVEIRRLSALSHNNELMDVFVDGVKVLSLRDGQSHSVPVSQGVRTFSASIGALATPTLKLNLREGSSALQVLLSGAGLVWMQLK